MNENLRQFLTENGYEHLTEIPGHGICGIRPMIFTFGLFCNLDMTGYTHRYCFGSLLGALSAIHSWDGFGDPREPWIKRKGEGGDIPWEATYSLDLDVNGDIVVVRTQPAPDEQKVEILAYHLAKYPLRASSKKDARKILEFVWRTLPARYRDIPETKPDQWSNECPIYTPPTDEEITRAIKAAEL